MHWISLSPLMDFCFVFLFRQYYSSAVEHPLRTLHNLSLNESHSFTLHHTFLKGRLFPSKEHRFIISRCPDEYPVRLFHVL